MGLTRVRNSKPRTRGMAMVEMVFVLPLLLLLVFAIAQFGLMFSRWLTLSNAVREGAREGAAFRGLICPGDVAQVETDVKERVAAYAQAGGVPIVEDDVNVAGACGGGETDIRVDATYDFELNIPFGTLASVPISYSSTMRNEQ